MKEELELKLVKKYPNLYRQYKGNPSETCMHWGFVCGNGWFDLIDKLSEKLSKFEGVEAAQVKEKFGGLRFYIDGTTKKNREEVHNLTMNAEIESFTICENCGNPGERRSGNWVRTLCDECEAKGVSRLK